MRFYYEPTVIKFASLNTYAHCLVVKHITPKLTSHEHVHTYGKTFSQITVTLLHKLRQPSHCPEYCH